MTTVAFSRTLPGSGITRASRTANTVGRRAPGRSAAGSRPRVRKGRARTAAARQRLRFIKVYPRQEWRTGGEPENRIGEAKGKCKKKWEVGPGRPLLSSRPVGRYTLPLTVARGPLPGPLQERTNDP